MTKPQAVKPKTGSTIDDFQKEFDKSYIIPQRIRDGLKSLGKRYMREAEFIRHCQVSQTDFSAYRDEFEDAHAVQVERNKRVWFGDAETASRAREMVAR